MPRQTRVRKRTAGAAVTRRGTEGPTTVTTTIALDEKTHYRLRQLALDERTTARDLIRAAPGAALVMRGQGRIFQRGGVWWIAYYHHALIRRRAGRRALQAPEETS
jgi:hypothetical protein